MGARSIASGRRSQKSDQTIEQNIVLSWTENRSRKVARSIQKRRKIDEKSLKIHEKSVWVVFGRCNSFRVAVGSRRNALGTASRRQVGPSWSPRWFSWPPCWPSRPPSWQPRTFKTAPGAVSELFSKGYVSSNCVRVEISSFVGTIVECPNFNFRQPVQCFVHFGRSEHRTRASGEKFRKSSHFGLQNRPRQRPGDPKSRSGGHDRARKRESHAKNL